jgi:hypothetical protein
MPATGAEGTEQRAAGDRCCALGYRGAMSTTPRIPVGGKGSGLFSSAAGLGQRFFALYGTLWQGGLLEQEVKEAARLRNARITDCGY